FVAPSRTEGLGLALLEAQAAGVPVLAAAVGGIPEVVSPGESGVLLEGHDPERWAEAIAALAADRPRLARLAAAAPERARRHSLEAAVRALEALYTELLAGASLAREAA